MLSTLGYSSMEDFIEDVVPADIRSSSAFSLNGGTHGLSESEVLAALKELASQNQVFRSFIGMGYYNCFVPPVIQRNILENPRLVYPIHAVSSRDFTGAFGGID